MSCVPVSKNEANQQCPYREDMSNLDNAAGRSVLCFDSTVLSKVGFLLDGHSSGMTTISKFEIPTFVQNYFSVRQSP